MALALRFRKRKRDSGSHADHGCLFDAKPFCNRIGGFEADAADIFRKPVGVFLHDLRGVGAIGFVNAHRP
jgi:hypothetical protein